MKQCRATMPTCARASLGRFAPFLIHRLLGQYYCTVHDVRVVGRTVELRIETRGDGSLGALQPAADSALVDANLGARLPSRVHAEVTPNHFRGSLFYAHLPPGHSVTHTLRVSCFAIPLSVVSV